MKKNLLYVCMLVVGFCVFNQKTEAQNYLINETFDGFPTEVNSAAYNGWTASTISGSSSVDRWIFDNSIGYSVPSPLKGKVALADAYSGGYVTGSNNTNVQDLALISPVVSTVGLSNLSLTWDQLFMQLNQATIFVEVSTNGGTNWTQVFTTTAGGFFGESRSLNLDAYVGNANFRVRFRWTKPGSTTHGYWMLDNVKLFSKYGTDVGITSVQLPLNNSCPSASQPLSLRVTNQGTSTISNVGVNLTISGAATGNFNTTIASILPGAFVDVFTGNTINTTAGGSINFLAIASLAGDQTASNDTLRVTVVTAPTPTDPSGPPIVQCGVGPVALQCSSLPGEFTVWFNDSLTATALGAGNPYLTPGSVYASRRFYAENTRNLPSYHTTYHTGVYRYNTANTKGGFFDITTTNEIVIDSISTNFAYAGNYIVKLYYKTGSYSSAMYNQAAWTLLGTDTVTTAGLGRSAYINPKNTLRIGAGQQYGFAIVADPGPGAGLPSMAFKLGTGNVVGVDFTIFANDVAEWAFNNNLNGYSTDVEVFYQKVCKSQRKGLDVVIIPRPAGVEAAKSAPYKGFYNSGTQLDPDFAKIGDTVTYELLPPIGFSNAQHGVNWVISSLNIRTANGSGPNTADTMTTLPGAGNARLRFIPRSGIDSVYIIRATIMNLATMCDTTITRYVVIAAEPRARFKVDPTCDGSEVVFGNTSTISSGFMNYRWYFGDGDSSDLANPVHTYATYGVYNVRLVAISNYGFTNTFDSIVTIYRLPEADFTIQNACAGTPVQFADRSFVPSGTPGYSWDFGDGANSTGANTSRLYSVPGSYDVTMVITVNGCSSSKTKIATQAPRASVNFTSNSQCNNTDVVFNNQSSLSTGTFGSRWKFGDGTESTGFEPNHKYSGFGTFDVKLIVTTNLGCVDSVSRQISVVESPNPQFTLSNFCAGELISATNQTNVPAGGANSYNWDFGNNQTSTATNPSFTYLGNGTYTITLTVNNTNGCSAEVKRTIIVDNKPIASFVAGDVCEGTPVDFMNSTVNAAPASTYHWNLDGFTSSSRDTTVTYTSNGAKNIELIVITPNGCRDTAQQTILVKALPNAAFIAGSALKGDGTFSFSGPAGSGNTYQWFMGDGSRYTTRDVDHTYPLDRIYTVRLVVISSEGCVNESTQDVNVNRVGVKDVDAQSLRVYPNPGNGTLHVDLTGIQNPEGSLVVLDMQGRRVWTTSLNSQSVMQLDLTHLSAGTYQMQVVTASGMYTARFNVVR